MSKLPDELELRLLSPHALIAYVARSGRRVQPLVGFPHGPSPSDTNRVERALRQAEAFATGMLSLPEIESFGDWRDDELVSLMLFHFISLATVKAAAVLEIRNPRSKAAETYRYEAVQATIEATALARIGFIETGFDPRPFVSGARLDYDALIPHMMGLHPGDEVCIAQDSGIFGPLWPEELPPGFPLEHFTTISAEGKVLHAYQLRHRFPKDDLQDKSEIVRRTEEAQPEPLISVNFDDSDFSQEDIELFLSYLSETYRELGGCGLKVVGGKTFTPEGSEVVQ